MFCKFTQTWAKTLRVLHTEIGGASLNNPIHLFASKLSLAWARMRITLDVLMIQRKHRSLSTAYRHSNVTHYRSTNVIPAESTHRCMIVGRIMINDSFDAHLNRSRRAPFTQTTSKCQLWTTVGTLALKCYLEYIATCSNSGRVWQAHWIDDSSNLPKSTIHIQVSQPRAHRSMNESNSRIIPPLLELLLVIKTKRDPNCQRWSHVHTLHSMKHQSNCFCITPCVCAFNNELMVHG